MSWTSKQINHALLLLVKKIIFVFLQVSFLISSVYKVEEIPSPTWFSEFEFESHYYLQVRTLLEQTHLQYVLTELLSSNVTMQAMQSHASLKFALSLIWSTPL